MSTYNCTCNNCGAKFTSYSEDDSSLCQSCQNKIDELEKKYKKERDKIDDDYWKKQQEINREYNQ